MEVVSWFRSLGEWGQGFVVGAVLSGLVAFLFGVSVAAFFVEEIHFIIEDERGRKDESVEKRLKEDA